MSECIFCKIINNEIPSEKLFEDEKFIVIKDINPIYQVHFLIIPKKHFASVNEFGEDEKAYFGSIFIIAQKLAADNGIDQSGYRLVVNTNKDAGQIVNHFHMHLLGGEQLHKL